MGRDEMSILIALCRRSEDDVVAAEQLARELRTRDVDWNELFLLSLWHKVSFLSLQRMVDLELVEVALDSGLPLLLLNHWKQLFRVNEQRNALLLGELGRIAASFREHGLPCVVAKGAPLLIGPCYRPSERKMYDLDLLSARDDYLSVVTAMTHAGYRLGRYNHSRSIIVDLGPDELRQWLLLSRGLPNFLRATGEALLEVAVAQVQFRVGSTGRSGHSVPAPTMMASAVSATVGWSGQPAVTVLRPSPIDTFLQLALHISRETQDVEHADWGMSWNLVKFCDMDRYLVSAELVPRDTLARAQELGFSRQCRYALEATHSIFPSAGPVSTLLDEFRAEEPGPAVDPPSYESIIEQMAGVGRPADRATSAWTSLMGVKTS